MNQPGLDLSLLPDEQRRKLQAQLQRLPQPLRDKLHSQLAKLPPEQLATLLEQGSPMLDKLFARIDKGAAQDTGRSPPPAAKPQVGGHYNQTVQPGDSNQPLVWLLLVIGVVFAALYASGLLQA